MVLGMCVDPFSYRGCYSASALQSRLISMGSYMYQSATYCQERCSGQAFAALLGGNECFCGDSMSILDGLYPTSGEECNIDCAGWPFVKCGGTAAMDVYVNNDFHGNDDDNNNSNNNNNNGDDGAAVQYTSISTRSLLQESMFEQHTESSETTTHPVDTKNGDDDTDNRRPIIEIITTTPHLPPLTVTEEKTKVLTPDTSVRTVFVTLTPSPTTYAVTETTVEITPIVIPIVSSVGYTRTVFTSLLYTISNRVPTTIVMTSTVIFQQQPTTSYIYSTLTRNEEFTKYSILTVDGTTLTKLVTSTYTHAVRIAATSSSLSIGTGRNSTVTLGGSSSSSSSSSSSTSISSSTSTRSPTTFVNSTRSVIAMVTTAGRGFSVTSIASDTVVSRENNGSFSGSSSSSFSSFSTSSISNTSSTGGAGEFNPYNRSTSGSHGLSGGAIAGIVIGCVFGTVLVLSLLLFLFLLRKRMYSRRMQRLNLGNEETKYYQPYSFGINDSTQPPMVPFSMLTPRGSRSLSPHAASNHSNYSRGLHMHNPLLAMSTGGEHLNRVGSNGVADISKNTSAGSGNNATFADVVRANLLPPSFYHGENLTSVTSFPDMGMENRLHIVNPDNPNDALSSDGNKEDDIDIDSNSSI